MHTKDIHDFAQDLLIDNDFITCPITQDIITKPCFLDTHYYEESSLNKWLEKSSLNPLTGLVTNKSHINKGNYNIYEFERIKIFKDYQNYKFDVKIIQINTKKNVYLLD